MLGNSLIQRVHRRYARCDMAEWLTPQEAAAYLKLHPQTLYRYAKAGKLRQYRPGAVGRPRFRREDLDALLLGQGEALPETPQ